MGAVVICSLFDRQKLTKKTKIDENASFPLNVFFNVQHASQGELTLDQINVKEF